ncbi:MAG: DUF4199 domain-containing protein [Cyclobacteriaceae bacterium]|nr:DUF4199 domain-containing protein [Cyclobacteriaceae bacterium]
MSYMVMKNKLLAVSLKYGIIGGMVSVLFFLILYALDQNPLVSVKVLDIFLLAIFIFFSIKEFRDGYNTRGLHYWQGMSVGVLTYLGIAMVSAFFILLMTTLVDPELTANYITTRIDLLDTNKQSLIETIDSNTYQEAVAGVKGTSGLDLALDDYLKKSIIGLFLTIIIAVVLRK